MAKTLKFLFVGENSFNKNECRYLKEEHCLTINIKHSVQGFICEVTFPEKNRVQKKAAEQFLELCEATHNEGDIYTLKKHPTSLLGSSAYKKCASKNLRDVILVNLDDLEKCCNPEGLPPFTAPKDLRLFVKLFNFLSAFNCASNNRPNF